MTPALLCLLVALAGHGADAMHAVVQDDGDQGEADKVQESDDCDSKLPLLQTPGRGHGTQTNAESTSGAGLAASVPDSLPPKVHQPTLVADEAGRDATVLQERASNAEHAAQHPVRLDQNKGAVAENDGVVAEGRHKDMERDPVLSSAARDAESLLSLHQNDGISATGSHDKEESSLHLSNGARDVQRRSGVGQNESASQGNPVYASSYCIHCLSGRRIYVNRRQSAYQVVKEIFARTKDVGKVAVALAGGHVVAAAKKAGDKVIDLVADEVMKAIKKEAREYLGMQEELKSWADKISTVEDEVAEVLLEVADGDLPRWDANGVREDGQDWRWKKNIEGWMKDGKFIPGMVDGDAEHEGVNVEINYHMLRQNELIEKGMEEFIVFFKNYQSVWAKEMDCTYYNSCVGWGTIPTPHSVMSHLTTQLIDNHPLLCGGKHGGMIKPYQNPVLVDWESKDHYTYPDDAKCLRGGFGSHLKD